MLKKTFPFLLFFLISHTVFPNEVDLDQVREMRFYNAQVKGKNYNSVLTEIKKKKEISYAEACLVARLEKLGKNTREAIRWYARCAFVDRALPEKYYPGTIIAYFKTLSRKSPLFEEAILELSKIFSRSGDIEYSSKLMGYLPDHPDPALKEEVLSLRAEIVGKLNPQTAIGIYLEYIKENRAPLYLYKIAGFYLSIGEKEKAIHYYIENLDFPEVPWLYTSSVKQILSLTTDNPELEKLLSTDQYVKIAEGYRLQKKYVEALRLWKKIEQGPKGEFNQVLYLYNYCLFKAEIHQHGSCVEKIKKFYPSLNNLQQMTILQKAGELLYKEEKFHYVVRMIPPDSGYRWATLIRVRALDKTEGAERRKEAGEYLAKYDRDSVYAEETFFRVCFTYYESNDLPAAKDCLSELSDLTKDSAAGGRARYYMAMIFEKEGKEDLAEKEYREVYLNSPAHFYTYSALEKVTPGDGDEIPVNGYTSYDAGEEYSKRIIHHLREWLSRNAMNKELLQKYFAKKRENSNYGVDYFWHQLENDLKEIKKEATPSEKKGILFAAMGFNYDATPYQKHLDTDQKYLHLALAGLLSNDANLQYTYIRLYLIMKKYQPDIMTMSDLGIRALYPTPFREYVSKYSQDYNLHEAQVYALMKQESAYHPGATSSSGARGLMQLMPVTANWMNKTLKLGHLNLYDPVQSIHLGASFYAWLNKVSDGSFEKMAIAYNAGPGRLKQWIERYYSNQIEIFLERIPVYETYSYVQKTRGYYDRYKVLLENYYPPQADNL